MFTSLKVWLLRVAVQKSLKNIAPWLIAQASALVLAYQLGWVEVSDGKVIIDIEAGIAHGTAALVGLLGAVMHNKMKFNERQE